MQFEVDYYTLERLKTKAHKKGITLQDLLDNFSHEGITHKNPVRHNDVIQCSYCGKSWDVDDQDPPLCTE